MPNNPFSYKQKLLASISRIQINDGDQYQVQDAMEQIAMANLRCIQCDQVCKLFRELLRRRIGTNEVESNIKRTLTMCTKSYQQNVKRKIVRAKLKDAYRKRGESRRKYHDIVNQKKAMIPERTWRSFVAQCRQLVPRYRQSYREKHEKKVEWLTRRYGEEIQVTPSEINGVDLRDQELGAEFDSQPRMYGNVTLNEEEASTLNLPPKFGIMKKVNVTETVIEVEKCLNTMRWKEIIGEEETRPEFYNEETKVMDINLMRPTDLPFNDKVCMPKAVSLEKEISFQNLKNEIKTIATEMNKKTRDGSNLRTEELNGLKTLKERSDEQDIVCFQTDKSGRWAVDTLENYTTSTERHIESGVRAITIEEYKNSEDELNCHAKALLRMMGLEDNNNGSRMRQACTAEGINFAELYSLRKDHKGNQNNDTALGPKSRPVCGCRDCGTKRTSYLLCQILRPLIPESATHCDSSETLRAGLDEMNEDEDLRINERWVAGSLDIEALFPNLDIDVCAGITNMVLYNSNIVFRNLKWKEIMLYLRYMLTDEQLVEKDLNRYAPKRKTRRGRPPLFTASGSEADEDVRMRPWSYEGCEEPDEGDTRRMWCEAIEILVKQTMKNHCFKFKGQLYRQESGGSIGLDLTGVIAEIYMSWWDSQLLVLLREERIYALFYTRYVDDSNMILDTEIGDDATGEPKDKVVMEKVKEIANTIHGNIRATCDYGSNYADGKLPVLDVKIWIGESAANGTKIMYEHYMKDVSSRRLLDYRSAHPETMKMNVLVNEAMRIMKNCTKYLPREELTKHLQYFANRMQYSGYPQEYRHEVLSRAIRRDEQWRMRRGGDGMAERRRTKRRNKDWYDRTKFDGVMFVDVTPNSELKHKIQDACKKNGVKVKVVEKLDQTVKKKLQKNNPYGWEHCSRRDCPTCNRDIRINCRARGCVYEIECTDCKQTVTKQYRGQTGRSIYERMKEHFKEWEDRSEDSYLQKHAMEYHQGETFSVDVKIMTQCYGKPSTRMITEAVRIEELPDENSLNSKSEWTYVRLPRVGIT